MFTSLFEKGFSSHLLIPFSSCSYIFLQEIMLHSRAFWVGKDTIAWNMDVGDGSCCLYGSKDAALSAVNGKIGG